MWHFEILLVAQLSRMGALPFCGGVTSAPECWQAIFHLSLDPRASSRYSRPPVVDNVTRITANSSAFVLIVEIDRQMTLFVIGLNLLGAFDIGGVSLSAR